LIILGGYLVTRSARRQHEVVRIVEEARLKAEQSDKFKSEFVTAMSHEIRGPLTNVQGFAELIATQDLDEATTRDFAETILRAVRHLLTVISTVLDAEKISHSRLVINPQATDVRRLLDLCLRMNEAQARAKSLQLITDIDDSVPAMIWVDDLRLSQVFHNLIGNAIKFTQSGSVQVNAEADQNVLRISVVDTGPGIAPEFQSRIFEKYLQGDPKLSRIHGGTGLGLNLSRMIVEMMGGCIYCKSSEGAGCTFVVELPLSSIIVKEVQSQSVNAEAAGPAVPAQ
jgi:signal transduction histidine kinase